MNGYDAIIATALLIETDPGRYNYFKGGIAPNIECKTPHCVIGWMAAVCGKSGTTVYDHGLVPSMLGVAYHAWADRMDAIHGTDDWGSYNETNWRYNAGACARDLRAYAEKYHKPLEFVSAASHLMALRAMALIVIADISMSLDNILAVAALARNHPILMLGFISKWVADLMERHKWLSWIGVVLIGWVAADLLAGNFNTVFALLRVL